MKTRILTSSLLALPFALPLVWNSAAQAQEAAPKARTIYLYNASLGSGPGSLNAAKSGPWGNGTVTNSRRVDYEGAPVLELVTRNLQEGVRFDFTTPVNLNDYQDSGFLRLRLRFRDGNRGGFFGGGFPGGGFPGGGFPGGGGGFPGGGFPGGGGDSSGRGFPGGGGFRGGQGRGGGNAGDFQMKPRWSGSAQFGGALPPLGGGFPGGFPGGGGGDPRMGGGGFNPEGGAALPSQTTDIKEIAVTLLRENGVTTGRIPVDLQKNVADEDGWRLFVLPIKNMTSTPGASGAVKRAIITSDTEDTIYLAQAALVIETGEMTASIRRPQDPAGAQIAEIEVKPGPVSLIADVEAGAADPLVEWNFDADNVGNLPPGALSSPQIGVEGEGGMPGMEGDPRMGGGGTGNSRMRGGTGGTGGTGGDPRMRGGTGGDPRMRGGGTGDPRMGGALGAGGGAEIGPRIDARGLTATFEYPNEEQNYRVEVTVTDRSGVKQPVKASILVRVRG